MSENRTYHLTSNGDRVPVTVIYDAGTVTYTRTRITLRDIIARIFHRKSR